jgi:hypothetical protein
MSDIPDTLANRHTARMGKDDNPGTYTVRAINPELEPPVIEESCLTATAADIRVMQLFAIGYNVMVIYSRTHKDDHADRT